MLGVHTGWTIASCSDITYNNTKNWQTPRRRPTQLLCLSHSLQDWRGAVILHHWKLAWPAAVDFYNPSRLAPFVCHISSICKSAHAAKKHHRTAENRDAEDNNRLQKGLHTRGLNVNQPQQSESSIWNWQDLTQKEEGDSKDAKWKKIKTVKWKKNHPKHWLHGFYEKKKQRKLDGKVKHEC